MYVRQQRKNKLLKNHSALRLVGFCDLYSCCALCVWLCISLCGLWPILWSVDFLRSPFKVFLYYDIPRQRKLFHHKHW